MNLAPRWVAFLRSRGIESLHWSAVGEPGPTDAEIMSWARDRGCVVFTHDLDFSALLARTQRSGPSVLQLRTQDVRPEAIGEHVVRVIRRHKEALELGAIVSVDMSAARVRVLPLVPGG